MYVYRGYDFAVANTIQMPDGDLLAGAVLGERFRPQAAVVHHGLVVFATERLVEEDGAYETVGVDFLYTQDYGETFDRVPVVGGAYGVPILEEARGIGNRLQHWSFKNPFPVNGLGDTTAAWFPMGGLPASRTGVRRVGRSACSARIGRTIIPRGRSALIGSSLANGSKRTPADCTLTPRR